MRSAPPSRPGFVVGLTAEARIAERFGYPVVAGGGTSEGAADAAMQLVGQGVNALVSFGFAGGLDPSLRPGSVVIPVSVLSDGREYAVASDLADRFGGLTGHRLVAGTSVAADALTKRQLHGMTRAHAISDSAERDLPPAALIALDRRGGIDMVRVLASLLRQPSQFPALLGLAADAARAHRALLRLTRHAAACGPYS